MNSEQRARRNEQQRRRRALQRLQTQDRGRPNPDSVRARRATQQRERRAQARSQIEAERVTAQVEIASVLNDLGDRVLNESSLTREEIEWMAKGQRYTQDPRLALAYYYCCAGDPGAFVFGDEQLRGDDGAATRERLKQLLADYPEAEDIAACQQLTFRSSSEGTEIWACASCGRIIMKNADVKVNFRRLSELQDVLLNDAERAQLLGDVPEVIVRTYRQVLFDGQDIYFLIPELVQDREKIPLCRKCYDGPKTNKFSVASGHDYGRIGQLPVLSDVAMACIAPVRCFGMELSLSGKHSSGHTICFPSSGPCELSRVLPNVDPECMPRVTFIGPIEEWRVQQKKFRKLYSIQTDGVYKWLCVLAGINNVFREEGITVDDTPEKRRLLCELETAIVTSVHVTDSALVTTIASEVSTERFGNEMHGNSSDCCCDHGDECSCGDIVIRQSAVLPAAGEEDTGAAHEIINAMLNTVSGEPENEHRVSVIAVKRGRSPYVEWVDNAKILAGVFPNLFLTGSNPLPSGPLPQDYVDHFMHYWDGRFEKSVMFTAMLFNQLQRHAAVHKAARVGTTHGKTLEKFGKLAATEEFKRALEHAKEIPDSPNAIRLNAILLRFLSLIGTSVPFSPFERAATRPKLGAMRFRYDIGQYWVTVAPPEHDDLILHRIAHLRQVNTWNDPANVCLRKECRFSDLPKSIQNDARERLRVSSMYPALSAQVFERSMKALTRDIIRCKSTEITRVSRNYLERERGVYGRVAAFSAVVEPQVDGRLHAHCIIYGSAVHPQLLTRLACCPELRPAVGQYLDRVGCASVSPKIREWYNDWHRLHGPKMPRAFDIDVPNAADNFTGILEAAGRRALATNTHTHSLTCRKGSRGRRICRLSRPAGIHDDVTQPLYIQLKRPSYLGKRERAEFNVDAVNNNIADAIDQKQNYANKMLIREHTNGVVVWEQYRPASDAMFVETNLGLACLLGSHTNSTVINGKDAGEAVEEYQHSYMTKEKGGLKCGAAVVLTALQDIEKFPSVADDSGTSVRRAKHLATRTVNAFTGAHEWPHSLMAYALAGNRSFVSSDTFWFVFPHQLVSFVQHSDADTDSDDGAEEQAKAGAANENQSVMAQQTDNTSQYHNQVGNDCIHEQLESLLAKANDDDTGRSPDCSSYVNRGARMFKLGDDIVFLTQAESYRHRGIHFEAYSPLEFEKIVDILPGPEEPKACGSGRGRPKRPGFELAPEHPLAPRYQGYIRAKFRTAMLGGAPPPSILENGQASPALSKYMLCLVTPWDLLSGKPRFDLTPDMLLWICHHWNTSNACFVNRQRYRYIENVLQKLHRSSRNEKVCSEWRSRNADFWGDCSPPPTHSNPEVRTHDEDERDDEANGTLSIGADELYEMTTAAAAKDRVSINAVKASRATFWSLIPDQAHGEIPNDHREIPVFQGQFSNGVSLPRIVRRINAMTPAVDTSVAQDNPGRPEVNVPSDNLSGGQIDEDERHQCSEDQRIVYDQIIGNIAGHGRLKQSLTILHGGGGTGKSMLIRRIARALRRHGIGTVNTCPTGVGASHLDGGKTFHSAFKALRKTELSANDLALLRLTFTDQIGLIVVDEMSMFSSEFLVLLDQRLRAIYRSSLHFGGRSILLAGDFLHLDVTGGTALCKMLYSDITTSGLITARMLFRAFSVCFLRQQHRAANCAVQQANLAAFRALPSAYPAGLRWTKEETSAYHPISTEVVNSVTMELSRETIFSDPEWLDEVYSIAQRGNCVFHSKQ